MQPPQVRIVHEGGPVTGLRVYVGDEQLLSVSKIEIVIDANDQGPVTARLTITDPELDLTALAQFAQGGVDVAGELCISAESRPELLSRPVGEAHDG